MNNNHERKRSDFYDECMKQVSSQSVAERPSKLEPATNNQETDGLRNTHPRTENQQPTTRAVADLPTKNQEPATKNPHALLAFDLGTRDLGIALGNCLTRTARPLKTQAMHPAHVMWAALDSLIVEWQPAALVVGLPLARDGSEQPMSVAAREFAASLTNRYGLPVALQDERGSSQSARRRFAETRSRGLAKRKDATFIDAHAAAVILEDYLATAGH